jgi:single-stranded-DNA-specific exonuclease
MPAWLEPGEVAIPPGLLAAAGDPLVARLLLQRGLADPQQALGFLDAGAYTPSPAAELPGVETAAARLEQAIRQGETICVWGDFDVDGQTATAVLVSGLQALGGRVVYHLPVRAVESHGVHPGRLAGLIEQGIGLLLTCDTGIAAHEALELARRRGLAVIVTDHHELPVELPPALALVNPRFLPAGHPLENLPGVGVAYKLLEEAYRRSGRAAEVEASLDLVALGIVADLAVQRGDARYLLQRGLEMLRRAPRLGLRVMMELAELAPERLTEEHLGFVLGPRLNALGRLGDANPAVELLTTADPGRARLLAFQLEGLNAQRQLLTDQVFQGVQAQIAAEPSLLDYAALVCAHPAWPAGVIGIVASRLVEHYNRPVVLLSAPPGELARGSARSVAGINITQAIAAQKDLLAGFGGHPMAAGLSLDPQRIAEFRQGLSRTLRQMQPGPQPEAALAIDAYLPLGELTLERIEQLERLAPFGPGNPPLVLACRDLHILRQAPVGRGGEHLQIVVEDAQGESRPVIWWNGAGWPLPEGRFDLAFAARTSTYRGERAVQMRWIDARRLEVLPAELVERRPAYQFQDYRGQPLPLVLLRACQAAETELAVWAEAQAEALPEGRDRRQLPPAAALAIWTTPPGASELAAVLQQVAPQRVILFAVDPPTGAPEAFLKRLGGLVKYAVRRRQGQASLAALAAAAAQRELAVRRGLEWLHAAGHVTLLGIQGDLARLADGPGSPPADPGPAWQALRAVLSETAAYRAHFARAAAETLLPGA